MANDPPGLLASRRLMLQAVAVAMLQANGTDMAIGAPSLGGVRSVEPSGGDDHQVLQTAIDGLWRSGGGELRLSPATYRLSAPLLVRSGVSLLGSPGGTMLVFAAGSDGLRLAPSTSRGRLSVRDLIINGNGGEACFFGNPKLGDLSGVGISLRNISLRGQWRNGFTFANLYGGTISELSTDTAECHNACFRFLGTLNGQVFSSLYTGHSSSQLYCFYFDMTGQVAPGGDLSPGLGNVFAGLVAQGGKFGLYVRCGNGLVFLSPYCENVARPIVIGTRASDRLTTGVEIVGCVLGGADPTNRYFEDRGPGIEIEYARAVRISTPDFRRSAAIAPLALSGGGGAGATGVALIGKSGRIVAAAVCMPGSGYREPPTVKLAGSGRLTARVEGGRVVGIDVVVPGSGYPVGGFPVAVLYGPDCHTVCLDAPYSGLVPEVPFSALVGRKQDANPDDGITIKGMVTSGGADLGLVKAQGAAHQHALTWHDAEGWQSARFFPAIIVD